MNNNRPEISLFFPAYNEQDNIAASVKKAVAVLEDIASRFEVIIVDDGSRDRTGRIADGLAASDSRIRVVHHSPNLGYGAALWSGIRAARYEWVFFTDADLQFDLDELKTLAAYIPLYDVVLGYRAPRRDPFMRLVNAKGWNILNRLLFGLKVRDIDCAFKLFRRDLVANMPLVSRGAAMSAEMLIRLDRQGVLFKEIPVTHSPRRMGSPTGAKPSVIIRAFRELAHLYIHELGPDISKYAQAAKFAVVGIINTFVDLAAYYILTRSFVFFAANVVSAKFLSFMLGTVSSFLLNRRYTFNLAGRPSASEIAKFYVSIALTVSVNVATYYILHTMLGLHDLVSAAAATVLTFAVGYAASKFWVFKSQDKKEVLSTGKKEALDFSSTRGFRKPVSMNESDWSEVARSSYE